MQLLFQEIAELISKFRLQDFFKYFSIFLPFASFAQHGKPRSGRM